MNSDTNRKKILNAISGIFLPIINLITAASIIKSILILLAAGDIISKDGGTYRIFYSVSDGVFFFMPFMLAITSARQFKADPFIAMMIPFACLYPAVSDILENGNTFQFL